MTHRVTLIPGDGIGPELTAATRRVLEATGVGVRLGPPDGRRRLHRDRGHAAARARAGLAAHERGRPQGADHDAGRHRLPLGQRRAAPELDLYANVRPAKTYAGVPRPPCTTSTWSSCARTPRTSTPGSSSSAARRRSRRSARWRRSTAAAPSARTAGVVAQADLGDRQPRGSAVFAFEYARAHRRRRVTAVHKANIMKYTDGLFLEVAREVASAYPDIEFNDVIVDNVCMQLVHAARAVRRAGAAQSLRRHRLRPLRGAGRRARRGARRQLRRAWRAVRAGARLGAAVQGLGADEPDRDDAVGRAHAAPPRGARRRRPAGARDGRACWPRAPTSPATSSPPTRSRSASPPSR